MLLPILQDKVEQKVFDASINEDLIDIVDDLELLKENFLSIQEYVYPFNERDKFIDRINQLILMLAGD